MIKKPTFIAFADLQIVNGDQWHSPDKRFKDKDRDDWWIAGENHAEIHLVAIDGTFRQIFFSKGSAMRLVGNTILFNASETDYLITDHSKKLSSKK